MTSTLSTWRALQVKENFERFISCKSTIDDIHVRLRKAEGDYGEGASGASTADMVAAVTDVGSLTCALIMPLTMFTTSFCASSCNVMAMERAIWHCTPFSWSVQCQLHRLLSRQGVGLVKESCIIATGARRGKACSRKHVGACRHERSHKERHGLDQAL